MIMMDLDHFKEYNDTFGHSAGDELLSALGTLLKSMIRGEDIACRYGGKNFYLSCRGPPWILPWSEPKACAKPSWRCISTPGPPARHPLVGRGRFSRPRRHRVATYPVGRRRPLPGQTCRPGPGDDRRICWRNHLSQSGHPAAFPPGGQLSLAFDSRLLPFPARLIGRSATGFPVNCTRARSHHSFPCQDDGST